MPPLLNLLSLRFTPRGVIIWSTAIFFIVVLLYNTRLIGGWYHYYSEYLLAIRGLSEIQDKCVYILQERNLWKRVFQNKDWYFRMRCEGNLDGLAREGAYNFNPLVSQTKGQDAERC
jgi:hypothetical protein